MDDVAGSQIKGIWERGRGPFAPWLGSPFCTAWLLPSRTGGGSVGGGTVSWHHLPPDCISLLLDLFISILVSALPVSACPCLFLCMKLNLSLSLSFLASDSHPTWLYVHLSLPFGLRVCLFLPVYVLGCVADGSRSPHLAGILPVLLVPSTHHVLGDLARVGMITLLAGHQVDVRTLDGVRVFTCEERWAMITPQSALLIDPPTPINPPSTIDPFSPLVPLFPIVTHSQNPLPLPDS